LSDSQPYAILLRRAKDIQAANFEQLMARVGKLLGGAAYAIRPPPTTLADVIFEYGEERHSRRIARAIVAARDRSDLSTTADLAAVIRRSVPYRGHSRIHPATRTFQALRIWVNHELDGLDEFLRTVARRLKTGTRLAVISFHSLEDRIVKYTLRELERGGELAMRVLTRKPIRPGRDEVVRNPRARSAKLRAAERVS
ncbi:MAG: 16S rRNA (cytosine(1402)-N(4))-methyltransferase RsmH, partial [Vicinamibacterales bacterium]|nr:16S rRNA (cytosine(1402)-N(4))-methyltransferase RsmH [Vicinamibacterales bacterium]